MPVFTLEEAADLADVKVPLLRMWLESGKFKVEGRVKADVEQLAGPMYFFNEEDIRRLTVFAGTQIKRKPTPGDPFVDDGKQENFTVAQIASLWQLSTDTIQHWFEDEAGVITSGDKNPRGKRKRITLRIPRAVMERVKRKRANKL